MYVDGVWCGDADCAVDGDMSGYVQTMDERQGTDMSTWRLALYLMMNKSKFPEDAVVYHATTFDHCMVWLELYHVASGTVKKFIAFGCDSTVGFGTVRMVCGIWSLPMKGIVPPEVISYVSLLDRAQETPLGLFFDDERNAVLTSMRRRCTEDKMVFTYIRAGIRMCESQVPSSSWPCIKDFLKSLPEGSDQEKKLKLCLVYSLFVATSAPGVCISMRSVFDYRST